MRLGIIIAIIAALIIGGFIYFVAGVSSTYPPIRKYEYLGSFNQFITEIRNYTSINPGVEFKITDTVGSKDNGYATYLIIEMKTNQGNIEYGLKCEEYNSKDNPNKTIISLVEAYNKTRIIGGYSKEAKGIEPLVNNFDVNFLTPLRKSQNIKITPLE